MKKVAYWGGVWGMVIIVVLELISSYRIHSSLGLFLHRDTLFPSVSFITRYDVIVIMTAFIELVIYALIRFRIRKTSWVIWHIGLSILAIVVIPIISIYLWIYSARQQSNGIDHTMAERLMVACGIISLALLLVSHIFFVLTIIHSLKKQKKTNGNETPGLLDEFID